MISCISLNRLVCLTHKEVVGIGIWSANLEQFHQIMELAMYVTADSDRAFLLSLVGCWLASGR
jgi:hypothetical protein